MTKQNGLIITVGTGTAGKDSNLVAGLIATIQKIHPRLYWLIPSAAPDSIATAALIRESCPNEFTRAGENADFFIITRHDDIFDCRTVIRRAIVAAKQQLRTNEQLLVNPTSGTKQMSAGATLAALDEEIGELVFTVGERADGVVKTGTERLATFDTREFFLDRDLRSADLLFQSGAYGAAAKLLEPYKDLAMPEKARKKALCMFEWHRLNYARAATHAALFDQRLCDYLRGMANDVEASRLTLNVLHDLLRGAGELRRWEDHEEAATRYYKALEYTARMRLANQADAPIPFPIEKLRALPLTPSLLNELRPRSDGAVSPSLTWMLQALDCLGDPLATAALTDQGLRRKLRTRNESMHEIRPVHPAETQFFCDRLNNLFAKNMPELAEAGARAPTPPNTLLESHHTTA